MSIGDVVAGLVAAVIGFVVVLAVCVAVLALIQAVLPARDGPSDELAADVVLHVDDERSTPAH